LRNRRDFLKLLGLAAGVSLTGCGGGSGSSGTSGSGGGSIGAVTSSAGATPVANAYHFTPLVDSGGALAAGKKVLSAAGSDDVPFTGAVLLNDRRHVCFYATDEGGRQGVYRIDYESNGATSEPDPLIVEGDVLPDGSVVDGVAGGALNNADDTAFVITDVNGKQVLECSKDGGPYQKQLTPYDDLADGVRLYGDLHAELAVSDRGDLLFCSNYRDGDGYAKGEGLFLAPGGNNAETVRIVSKDDLLPGTGAGIRGICLFDLGADGSYLVQGSAAPLEAPPSPDGVPLTYLLRGRLGETPEILFADSSLGVPGVPAGSVNMGPRVSSQGYGAVVQTGDNQTALWVNGSRLLEADFENGGMLSPRGAKIISMFPPAFGPSGLMFVEIFTPNGAELLVYQGQTFATILATGDRIGDKIVDMFLFGALPHCVNDYGEIALAAYYTDGTSSVVLGMPV
jgi:hypothetical protein